MSAVPAMGRLSWIERDGRLIIAARTLRSFAQTSVMVVIAIYLGLRGFSLVEIGLFLSLGSAGAAMSAVIIGLVGDTWGRRWSLVVLGVLMSVTGIVLAVTDTFAMLAAAAFF